MSASKGERSRGKGTAKKTLGKGSTTNVAVETPEVPQTPETLQAPKVTESEDSIVEKLSPTEFAEAVKKQTGSWSETKDAVNRERGAIGPLVAVFAHQESRHPKPIIGRNGESAESTYAEQQLSLVLRKGGKRLWAPYLPKPERVLGSDSIACGASLLMQVLVLRVVDPEGQRDKFKRIVGARKEWLTGAETNAALKQIVDDLHAFVFPDGAGFTLVWTLPQPFTVATIEDAECWGDYYSAIWKLIEVTYKVKVDGDAADCGTLFEGARCDPYAGDPCDVAPCTLIPVPFPPTPGTKAVPPAPSPGKGDEKPNRIADIEKLLTEITLTTYARAEKYTEAEAASFLAACSGTLPAEVQWTQYEGGKEDTRNGAHRSESFSTFGAMLYDYATRTVAKGTGQSFIGAVSRNGRCRDADIEGITMLTLDCDAMGEWDRMRRVLDETRLAYVIQRSSSHKPDKPKWHLTISLTRPWISDKPAWRAIWRFVIGMFSGIAGLPPKPRIANEASGELLFGFDHTTDRIGQPIFPAAKREKSQSPPETIVVATGHALDLDELLAQGGFDPAWRAARTAYEPREPSSVDPSNGLLALAFGKAGMLGQRIERESIRGYAVECPKERQHSSGQRFDTSTMIADPSGEGSKGFFVCKHGCGNMKPETVLGLLPPEAVDWARAEHAKAKKKAAKKKAVADLRPGARSPGARGALENAEPLGCIEDLDDLPEEWMHELLWVQLSEDCYGPKTCAANAITILTHDQRWADVLARNDFAESDVTRRMPPWHEHEAEGANVGPWTDPDTTRLCAWFDRAYGMMFTDRALEHVVSVAAEARRFHPVRQYLRGLKWDGVPRLHSMLATYFGAKASAYATAVGTRWPVGAVARVMRPGCQMDCTLVFEGEQGIGKNRAVRAFVPDPEWYSETRIEIGTKDSFQNLRGKWIYLLDELDSLKRADLSRVKGFLTSPRDTYRESYGRRARDFQRQTVFCGTTNEDEWLTDTTGNRRFWPIHVHRPPDIAAIERDRDQLWAEAVHRYDNAEVWHVDTPELRQLCEEEQGDRVQRDIWLPTIAAWLAKPVELVWEPGEKRPQRYPYDDANGVLTIDIAVNALEKPKGQVNKGDQMRIAGVLASLGYERGPQRWESGVRVRRYVKTSPAVTSKPGGT